MRGREDLAGPGSEDKILKGKLEWKWGHAQCEAEVQLDRAWYAKVNSCSQTRDRKGRQAQGLLQP